MILQEANYWRREMRLTDGDLGQTRVLALTFGSATAAAWLLQIEGGSRDDPDLLLIVKRHTSSSCSFVNPSSQLGTV